MSNLLFRLLRLLPHASRQEALIAEKRFGNLPALKNSWKLLHSAYSRLHCLISAAQEALREERFISMVFLRSQCTGMFVNAFAVLRHLREMTELKHASLEKAFQDLRQKIEQGIASVPASPIKELILPLSSVDKTLSQVVGTKMAYLGEVKKRFPDLPIPDGFVITSAAYDLFLDQEGLRDEINRRLQTQTIRNMADMFRLSSELQLFIINAAIPEKLQDAIRAAYQNLEASAGHRGVRVAIRSSAVGEDSSETSFAGQYRTELNVSEELLLMAYKEVLASKYSLTAMNYRFSRGLKDEDMPMCVGCMVMVDTASAGVMYTQDPTSPDTENLFVNAVHGMAKAISDGYVVPDQWVIAKQPSPSIMEKHIHAKEKKFVTFLAEEGVTLLPTTAAQKNKPALTDQQALDLAKVGMLLEEHLQCPLDIEWALAKSGRMFILQSRSLKRVQIDSESSSPEESAQCIIQGGQMASPGKAVGQVFMVNSSNDLLHFPDGAVLVSKHPHPRWSALLPRAVAIVTESGGGIFGHLANIAREFGIPAIFDMKGACALLPPGETVTVNASRRAISRANAEDAESFRKTKKRNMRDTPVYLTLREVLGHTAVLTRANPLDPRVVPESIATLRDMVHASQLLASREVLKLAHAHGRLHPLAVRHPANWWILDLDDIRWMQNKPLSNFHPEPFTVRRHPLLDATWQGIEGHQWPLFTNSQRRNRLLKALRRLRAAARPLSPPRPRLFIHCEGILQFYLSLERAFFLLQAQAGQHEEENFSSLLWQWFPSTPPPDAWLQEISQRFRERGFNVDTALDGLFAWTAGSPCETTLFQARFLGYMIGAVQTPCEHLNVPPGIDALQKVFSPECAPQASPQADDAQKH